MRSGLSRPCSPHCGNCNGCAPTVKRKRAYLSLNLECPRRRPLVSLCHVPFATRSTYMRVTVNVVCPRSCWREEGVVLLRVARRGNLRARHWRRGRGSPGRAAVRANPRPDKRETVFKTAALNRSATPLAAVGHGHAVLSEDLLRLILVDLHRRACPLSEPADGCDRTISYLSHSVSAFSFSTCASLSRITPSAEVKSGAWNR